MSGRGRGGRGAGRGRFFRGAGKPSGSSNNKNNNNTTKSEGKKTLTDYNYYVGSAKQASDYETATEFIINHIKKTYEYGNDIGTALKNLEEFDASTQKPSMQVSIAIDTDIREAESRQYEIEFKAEYDIFRKRQLAYQNNRTKAYALLWERCTRGMKNKIEARTDFESDIEDNPIALLQAIKEHALNYQEHRFKRYNGLYVHKPLENKMEIKAQFVSTVEENKTFYTEAQIRSARRARDLYHAIGTPSIGDFKAIVKMNMIRDCPITTKDINMAEKIFGQDIGAIKGKTTRRRPTPVVEDYIEIPQELIAAQHDVTLCFDVMYVNGLAFLTTISKNLYYRTAAHVRNKNQDDYLENLTTVLRVYERASMKVTEARCDNEFRPLVQTLQDSHQINMNFANAGEHVPEAERNNRVIKERTRATYHRLPYKQLPRLMLKVLVMDAAKKLNFFPAKNGVSKYYSPRAILHQKQLDYNKHCKYALGTYVQGHDDPNPTNTNAPRTLDCIYLRYNDSHQGGHELLHLPTNAKITRRYVTPIPITPAVIREVEALAEREGMPRGLKIANRTGNILYDSTWIAGVDYDQEMFDDDDYEEENEDEDEREEEEDVDDEDHYDQMDPDEIVGLADVDELEDENEDDDQQNNEQDDNGNDEQPEDDEHQQEEDDQQDGIDPEQPEEEEEHDNDDEYVTTRSGRTVRPPARTNMNQVNVPMVEEEYTPENARVIAKIMHTMNFGVILEEEKKGNTFVQTFSLAKGLKKFGDKGKQAAMEEMKQLHDRVVFKPIKVEDLEALERRRAMESLIFLTEKRDGRVKARKCANGSTQRGYVDRDEAASPTATTESHLITAAIDAKEGRDVMTADIPNAFVQTDVEEAKRGERIIMKIRGALVDMLIQLDPDTYQEYVIYERGQKVLYVLMLKALYGMLQSSLLYYKKFRKDIESIGFKVNPYDPCVANRVVAGKQQTITWHVDDLKSSHVDKKINDKFKEWLTDKYASDNIGEVKAIRGNKHDYLAMVLDFSEPGVLRLDMTDYVKAMVHDFPEELNGKSKCPWNENLFKIDKSSKKLDPERAKILHTFAMKAMFLCKRARQDILPAVAFLATRVKEPNESDWNKLVRMMNFLKATQDEVARISCDSTGTIKWHVDVAFAVHHDMRSHTGGTMTLGKGSLTSDSLKQKVNSRSSTEAELIGVDDELSKILWTKRFMEAQGYHIESNTIYRDNTSSMKLETNGKASSGKRTRHFDIKYFYITDLIQRGEVSIEYCPTDSMIADYMTKPLTGAKFIMFRNEIMGYT